MTMKIKNFSGERATALRRRWSTRLLAAALLTSGAFAGCSSLDEQTRRWIFQPAPAPQRVTSVTAPRTDGFTDVWIEHRSTVSGSPVRLHALWVPQADKDAPVMLYLHGARRHVEAGAFRVRQMHALGFAVLAVDYRGFGASTDELPSEPAVVEDAQAAWAWLAKHHADRPRYIYGHSLGGAIAVALAARATDERGLIVEASFPSIADVFRTLRWGWLPIGGLIGTRFDSAEAIAKVGSPVLVVHGGRDSVIRPELGRSLYERAAEPKRFLLVEDGTHSNSSRVGQAQVREAIADLFGIGRTSIGRSGGATGCRVLIMATLKLKPKPDFRGGQRRDEAPSRAPLRGAGSVARKRPTLAQAQAERAERTERERLAAEQDRRDAEAAQRPRRSEPAQGARRDERTPRPQRDERGRPPRRAEPGQRTRHDEPARRPRGDEQTQRSGRDERPSGARGIDRGSAPNRAFGPAAPPSRQQEPLQRERRTSRSGGHNSAPRQWRPATRQSPHLVLSGSPSTWVNSASPRAAKPTSGSPRAGCGSTAGSSTSSARASCAGQQVTVDQRGAGSAGTAGHGADQQAGGLCQRAG